MALLEDAFGGEPPLHVLPLFRCVPQTDVTVVRQMIAQEVNAPLAHGVGRYFDALGALGLGMPESRYEGEVAFRWNMAADENERGRYEVVIRDGAQPWEIDLRPLVRSAVRDLIDGVSPATVSARFHNTIGDVSIEVGRGILALRGDMPVVISGGCFQNAGLAESIIGGLPRVYMNREIPPGDGGVALGQAIIANAVIKEPSCASEFPEKSLTSTAA